MTGSNIPEPPLVVPSWLETNAYILAATGAIALASHRSLQKYLGAVTLTPPSLPPLKAKSAESPPSRLRRFTSKLLGFAIPALLGWGIPQYSPKLIINIFYLFGGFCFLQEAIYIVIILGVPCEYSLFLEYSTPDDPSTKLSLRTSRSESLTKYSRIAASTSAAALLALAYFGLLPAPLIRIVLPSLFIFYALLFVFANISVRYLTYIVLGDMAFCALVVGTVVFICSRRAKGSSPPSPPRDVFPSDWICDLARAAAPSVFVCHSFFITTLTFRYEYVRAHGLPERLGAAGEKCPVPSSLKPFRPVLSASSLLLFAAAEILARGVYAWYLPAEWAREMMYSGMGLHMCLLAPAVFAVIASVAWMRGELADWWNYSETWIPKSELDSATVVNDDEKAIDGDVSDDRVRHYDEKTLLFGAPAAAKS